MLVSKLKRTAKNLFFRTSLHVLVDGSGGDVILNYHSVGTKFPQSLDPAVFRRHLELVTERFEIVPLKEFTRGTRETPENRLAITFDDGYRDNFDQAAPVLEDFNCPATFFITVGRIGNELETWSGNIPVMTRSQVRKLNESGHTIGSHGLTHSVLTDLEPAGRRREVQHSRKQLASLLGTDVNFFSYPHGGYNSELIRLVKSSGYDLAVTTDCGYVRSDSDAFRLPRITSNNQLPADVFVKALMSSPSLYEVFYL